MRQASYEMAGPVRKIMARLFQFAPEEIKLESRFSDNLSIDLTAKMQELSKQTIEQESIKEVRTVADIVDLVERIRAK